MAHRLRTACAAALGVSAVVLCASRAQAQDAGFPNCTDAVAADTTAFTGSATIVYIAGSSASQVPLEAIAPTLAGSNVAIVYQSPDSCQGVNDLLNHTNESATTKYVFLDPQQLDANGLAKPIQCVPPSPAPPIDIAPSDVFPDTCASKLGIGTAGTITTTSNTFRDILGPVQAMTLAVPSASTANAISAEAGNIVFANDAMTYSVMPWTSSANIFTRPDTSGTMNMLGAAMGLSPTNFANATPGATPPAQQQKGTGNMLTALTGASSANANTTIGQLSYSSIQTSATPSALKILAFQAKGQKCGYTPGSTATALDMINVRQGRYAVFGPLHFIVNVSSSGQYLDGAMNPSAAVTSILGYFLATGPTPPSSSTDGGVSTADIQKIIKAEAKPGFVVPWCAMQVSRSSELGAPASYQPSLPCGCYYESLLGVIPSSGADPVSTYCHSCGSDSDCADSGTNTHCRYGYCEAQ